MVICLERSADLHMAQLMPLPLTVSCFSKIQIGFTFLVPAHPGSPGKRAVKRICVCVCISRVRHIRSSNVGYDGTHGGSGYGFRNGDSFRILEFADKLNLVICNTLFMKQESKLVTYVAGPVKSTVDYIMVWPVVY